MKGEMEAFMEICSYKQSRKVKIIYFERGDTLSAIILSKKQNKTKLE